MATKLGLYNGALRELGERPLASLTEAREPRRLLDAVYDAALLQCLQKAQWKFATRTVELTPETDFEASYGYQNLYIRPTDWQRTTKICSDPFQKVPLLEYHIEAGFLYADIDPLYWSYVSDDAGYGLNLADWPANYTLFVETHLATLIVSRITDNESKEAKLHKLVKRRLTEASSTDAMEAPTEFAPMGSWVRSRLGSGTYRDRGSRTRLLG